MQVLLLMRNAIRSESCFSFAGFSFPLGWMRLRRSLEAKLCRCKVDENNNNNGRSTLFLESISSKSHAGVAAAFFSFSSHASIGKTTWRRRSFPGNVEFFSRRSTLVWMCIIESE